MERSPPITFPSKAQNFTFNYDPRPLNPDLQGIRNSAGFLFLFEIQLNL